MLFIRNLPIMHGDAVVARDSFDFVLDDPCFDHRIFVPPRMPVSDTSHMIGLYARLLRAELGSLMSS